MRFKRAECASQFIVYREAGLFQYVICGLSVDSEIALPEVQETHGRQSAPDVIVRRGRVPLALDGASGSGPTWQITESRFLFHVPGVARYLIATGREVVIEAETSMDEADALPFLLGTGFGAILHQRGCLVLHAATVSLDGRGVALCGPTGIGKSTLAAALCRMGCGFVSDDVTAIRFDTSGRPIVSPDGRRHRLWADAVEHLSLADRRGSPVRAEIRKFHVDPTGHGTAADLPLAAVVTLSEAHPALPQGIVPLSLADAASLLRKDVYRPSMPSRMGRDAQVFGQTAEPDGDLGEREERLGKMLLGDKKLLPDLADL